MSKIEGKNSLKLIREKISEFGKFFKGSSKDPLCYFGFVSVILFGILIFFPCHIINDSSDSLLVGSILEQLPKSGGVSFLDSAKKLGSDSPEFILIQNSTLLATSTPLIPTSQVLGALIGGFELEDIQKIIIEYLVEPGDSFSSIVAKFDISLETVLWANNLSKSSVLKSGQKLIIPPVSGVIHHVKAGETVSQIAQRYKAKSEDVVNFNNLSGEAGIFVGDILVVPNGIMPAPKAQSSVVWTPLSQSYFICPISSPCRITQGLHWYNAIDFSHGKCGEPIYAAAAGKVLRVQLTSSTSRWAFGGAGNNLTILHPNGVVTMYGHIAASFVSPGDEVSQGQIIALMGGQPGTPGAGMSTGCHLHFGVTGARNPFSR